MGRNKLGAQCQMNTGALLRYCEIVRPEAAMGVMVQDREFYLGLRSLGVRPIYRHWPNWHWAENPEAQARAAVEHHLVGETAGFRDLLAYVLGNNEYIYSFDHARHELADRFASSFIGEVHTRLGIHAIVLNLNTGHFRDDVLVFPRTLQTLSECGICRLGWHEYDWPTMDRTYREGLVRGDDGCWQTLRWKVAGRAIKDAGYRGVKFAITECGIDGGVVPGQDNLGWRKVHDDYAAALSNYKNSLGRYIDALERDDDVDLALLFGAGLDDDWVGKGFEVPEELARWIAGHRIYPEVKRE